MSNFAKESSKTMSSNLFQIFKALLFGSAFTVALVASGCGEQGSPPTTASTGGAGQLLGSSAKVDQQILSNFVDNVIIPNHDLFAQQAKLLSQKVDLLVKTPNDQTLKAAQSAWISARSAWEQTECFGFGPASSLGYDGALDSWPVNETDFKAMLKSGISLNSDSIEKLKETEKGFHVIEYFLFGQNKSRQASDLVQRDLNFLQLLGVDFAKVARDLATSWSKGISGKPPYRDVLITAGESGNSTYPTVQAGVEEMIQGMVDSLDEVANEKIGEAFQKKDPKLAESRFSLQTLTDMKSNLQGAQNVYLGSFSSANARRASLSARIAQINPQLDREVKASFQAAMDAMGKIPAPFEMAILDPNAAVAITQAQSAVNTIRETLEDKVKPLVVQS
jgi:putative iron-regulated protein